MGVIYSSCAGLARGNYEPKCSDNWYDFCNSIPTPAAASHETTIESCYLSCALENILGYCDWFIYEPKAYQSCKMYTTPMDAFLAGCTARQGGPTCLTDDVPPNDCAANCPPSQGPCAAIPLFHLHLHQALISAKQHVCCFNSAEMSWLLQ